MEKRNAANETAIGGIADFRIGSTNRIGLSALKAEYDKQVAMYSPFGLSGKSISAFGANADFVFDSFSLFGEFAGNSLNTQSGVAGFIYRVSKRVIVVKPTAVVLEELRKSVCVRIRRTERTL